MLNNRQQSGRRRGRGGQRQQGNGRDNGNRIDNRARGNAPQLLEKYKTLARDSQLSGDRVMTEYYLQFADHYFRVVAESRARFEETRRQRDDWQGEEGYEGEEQNLDQNAENYAEDGQDEDRPQQQQPRREFRERNDRDYNRDGNRDNRDNNRDRGERDGNRQRYANDRNGNGDRNGNRFNGNRAREEEDERTESGGIDIAVLPPAFASDGPMTPIDIDDVEPAPAKPRRGRPRKAAPETEAGSEG